MLDSRSKALRLKILEAVSFSRRGHIGSAFSMLEIVRVLYDDVLSFDSKDPLWPDRDRFILSKGHGCLALYVMLLDKGFIKLKDLHEFCKFEGILGGHPEKGKIPGVEASTGSLGHGLSVGVGMALAAKMTDHPYQTFVLMGDGEINEGSVWEAALSASKHRLSNLTAIIDYNKIQSFGRVPDVVGLEPLAEKWKSFGFSVFEGNGHDLKSLRENFLICRDNENGPSLLLCHTKRGKGVSFIEDDPKSHYTNKVTDDELEKMRQALQ